MSSSTKNGYLTVTTTGITDTNMLLGQCVCVWGGGGGREGDDLDFICNIIIVYCKWKIW